jgi:hypothetical protein
VLIGEGVVLGKDDSELAEAAWLKGSHGGAGSLAYLVDGEALYLAEAYQQEAFGFEAAGCVEEEGFTEGCFELAAAYYPGGGVGDGVGGRHESDKGLVIFSNRDVYRKYGKERS